ncbi:MULTISPECIES: hypothetical protein [Sulfitobacter]|jgi:hypothetical protein|uniref:hypothetical protein n=1 Tax=Sulfitobacter TaxID=60136 RepID=UPI000C654622|nr:MULTISPECIES: hypothetical protein [Sulfitobacter]MAX77714.1 hypothetical protein [Roseobacter sp.]HAR82266.1 hypothetical protein [Sulfitobacter pontiacus]|tara:strand:+ start:6237 stop:6437 length:201 start_codon:yes stop_codon:yes gene_type:complete
MISIKTVFFGILAANIAFYFARHRRAQREEAQRQSSGLRGGWSLTSPMPVFVAISIADIAMFLALS